MIRCPLVLLALLAFCLPAPAGATHPASCPDGVYTIDGPPIFPTATAVQDAIIIDHGRVAIASGCEAVPASIHRADDGSFYLRARWRRCGEAWRVHLRAKIGPQCQRMAGVVSSARPRMLRRFVASQCSDPAGCPPAACTNNAQCPPWGYCAKAPGDCAGQGRCVERPGACPDVWLPVCGCDGRTYSNPCDAAASGVNVARAGACDASCGPDRPCADREFCEQRPGTCGSGEGVCELVPDVCPNDICGNCDGRICPLCPLIYQPVCGCDGVTYGSDCQRRKARVSKAHDGACDLCPQILCAPGTRPVDRDGDGCAETCLAPCRDACDCKINPNIRLNDDCPLECATCGDYWTCQQGSCVEVCGPKPVDQCRICGGLAGLPCERGQVCDLPAGTCNWADLFGVCRTVGDACIALYDPVCGCDGVTYGNDCERLRAGAQLDHKGECRSRQ